VKYVSFADQETGTPRVGVLDVEAGVVAPLPADAAPEGLLSVVDRDVAGESGPETGTPVSLAEVRLLAPLPRPRHDLVCVGKNYAEHATEFARSGKDATGSGPDVPTAPIFFTKAPSTVVGPDDVIDPHPGLTDALDYEAEIAVIIGRGGRGISAEDAMDHVWGYTLVNDVTARDLQERHKQWYLGKSLDTFCPMGPWAVTADEVDLTETWLECRVNDELRQRACTTDLVFDVPTLIATLSAGITLAPGDVIATGTPAGVALGFNPPRYLVPGDVVEVSATNLGVLRNVVGDGVR
jgi:2-keto-4-pentenoate hydratase/2-oxohepta-3-ene-1,7-dioic acid hydratase in catechol pathway